PLDGIHHWNRMYGKKGFLQYQCLIPPEVAKEGVREMLSCISNAQAGSFLAVLKAFGNKPSIGVLSYPTEGVNLALDFPYQGEKTYRLFNTLTDIVLQAGGRIYPAKDAHMSAEAFQTFYPKWKIVEALKDPNISSSFWRRVTGDGVHD
ncbi:MAG: FAD-binding protein, partial [Pseudomonadota bacterium]